MENNTQNIADKKGQTITFYSYKGGVGRSMALVNIACLAAKENKKILLIDCDLEAPGLHQFFKTSEETPGFVDLIATANEWTNNEENNNEEAYCEYIARELKNYISKDVNPIAPHTANLSLNKDNNLVNSNASFDTSVKVDLIKAGKFGAGYSEKLNAINWLAFYKKSPAFFRTFAYCLEKDYDYIFIDARTGLADTSGICTMLMPQKLVLVFALNNQNINGVVDVAKQAIEYRFSSNDYRELQVYPLPSRIENSANPYLQQWIDNYKDKFSKLFIEKYMLDECNLSAYFDRSFIQYYAIHAYGENIPALYESSASSNFITYNYNNFLTVLKKNIPAWEVISFEEESSKVKLANEHIKKGLDLYFKKEYEKAIEENNKAIDLIPDDINAYVNRGTIKQAIKLYDDALKDYDKAISLVADDSDIYFNRGILNFKLLLFDKAIADFNRAIELQPSDADAYCYRGNVKNDCKLYEEAIKDYDKAIEIKPDHAEAFNNRGIAKASLNLFADAMEDHDKAIKIQSDNSDFYSNRGTVKESLQLHEDAIKDYDKAIEIQFDNAKAFYNRGNAKESLELYEEAIMDYDRAIELKPDYSKAFNNRGLAKKKLKRYINAIEDYDKALELDPDFEGAIRNKENLVKMLNETKG